MRIFTRRQFLSLLVVGALGTAVIAAVALGLQSLAIALVASSLTAATTSLSRGQCNNPAAEEIEDLTFEGTAGAAFELPANLISFRSARRTGRKLTEEQKQAAAANFAKARESASAGV